MQKIKFEKVVDLLVFVLAIILSNSGIWLCLTDLNDPLSFCSYQNPGVELLLYMLASSMAIWLLARKGLFKTLLITANKNKPVLAFTGLAILSIGWSVFPLATLYQVFILLFTTILAAYLGIRFTPKRLLTLFFWWALFVVSASFLLLIFFPGAAIMGEPHPGTWRGVYWHKNFTGSLMAFANLIFLLYGFSGPPKNWRRITVCVTGYVLSLIFIVFSQSAAGIAIWLILNFVAVILLVWNKIKERLEKVHYFIISGFSLIIGALVLSNINVFLGIINRSSSLTGRLPLWNTLLTNWVYKQPFFGHGFAALWRLEEFRRQVSVSQGWSFEITNGHNGFMDILLGLGIAGLVIVVVLLVAALFRTVKFFIKTDGVEAFFPFLIVLYFLAANLSISFFLELESFHWLLLMIALFMATPALSSRQTPAKDERPKFH